MTQAALVGARTSIPEGHLLEVFAQTLKAPEVKSHPALIGMEGTLCSFGELASIAMGIRGEMEPLLTETDPERPIALLMMRGPLLVQTFIAALSLNRTVLPLDPTYPNGRLSLMIEAAKPALLLHDSPCAEAAATLAQGLPSLEPTGHVDHATPLQVPPVSQQPIALYFTSGSTGRPKGVPLTHRGVYNRFAWMWSRFPFEQGERTCFKTSVCFVDSLWEVFGGLFRGLPLVITPPGLEKEPDHFAAFLAQTQVTRLVVVPSLLRILLNEAPQHLKAIRYLTSSGEALVASVAASYFEHHPHGKLLNLYGSTEVTGDATGTLVQKPVEGRIPLGEPVDNNDIYLLDENLKGVSEGEQGAIYVAGEAVCLGYLDQSKSKAFIANPDTSEGAYPTLYRTGDIGCVLRDAENRPVLVFMSRQDEQIKILGQRVHPSEIERVLDASPLVDQVAAVVQHTEHQPRLLAFVKPHETPADMRALRQLCMKHLPVYMQPTLIVTDSLPTTPNGKLDRRALQDSPLMPPVVKGGVEGPLAAIIHSCWVSVFGDCDADTDFFQLGATSLQATQFLMLLEEQGFHLDLARLYENPTRADLWRILRKGQLPKMAVDITARALRIEEREQALELLSQGFQFDQLSMSQGAQPKDYKAIFSIVFDVGFEHGFFFAEEDTDGSLIGVTVACDYHVLGERMPEFEDRFPEVLGIMFAMFEEVEHEFHERFPDASEGKWVYAMALTVPPNLSKGQGKRLITSMEAAIIRDARQKGYRGVVTLNVHPSTRFICKRLGYEEWNVTDVRTWEIEGEKPFEGVSYPNDLVALGVLDFQAETQT